MINHLFFQALNLSSPWKVVRVDFSREEKRLDIYLDFERGSRFNCPVCGLKELKVYDTNKERVWRHLNFFQYEAYLHCRLPRVKCPECGVKTIEVLWARPKSGFTMLFEALVMTLAKEMSVKGVAGIVGEHDTRIWRVIAHYVEEARKREDYSEVKKVGMDETARKRGHKYVSIFTDLEKVKVLFATEGKDSSTVTTFSEDLIMHNGDKEKIEECCCDMSPAFIEGIEREFSDAEITFDKFHVMKIMNEAVDKVRREEQRERKELHRTRYLWLRNPANLSARQREEVERLTRINLRTVRAYHIGLNLREFWEKNIEEAEAFLKRWYFWATHSRLEPIKQAAYTIKRHWKGILNYFHSRITNGVIEAINGLVQLVRTRARGYRSVKNFITMIYLIGGKLDFQLPT